MFDISIIVKKLENANLVEKRKDGSYGGFFSIKNHSHLLTAEELEFWLTVLHNGSCHDDKKCTDLHRWNLQPLND